jgi:radical SAM superfamily enzyme YgiQ (UPF0313 family)
MKPEISALLINPWITDFAAYNLWAEPLGLLYVAAVLRAAGARITHIDCLFSDVHENPHPKRNGCSKYRRSVIEKPRCLSFVRRQYARYGMPEEEFLNRLHTMQRPDVVLVTSMMTYWYPGILMVLEHVRERFGKDIPVVVGGVYALLCAEHAEQHTGNALLYRSRELQSLLPLIEGVTGKRFDRHPHIPGFDSYPLPVHDLSRHRRFFSVLTGVGCPYDCSYCASPVLHHRVVRRSRASVREELEINRKRLNTPHIAFYDDALLFHARDHVIPMLQQIAEEEMKLSIHLPNGIHARYVTEEVAYWFRASGVETIRIGLETADPELQSRTGGKTRNDEFRRAVEIFRSAGYSREDVGTYILVGLPGQTPHSVEQSIAWAGESGAAPHLSYFSPIPGTAIWEQALKDSPLPAHEEPLFQNNSVHILKNPRFTEKITSQLKEMAVALRNDT